MPQLRDRVEARLDVDVLGRALDEACRAQGVSLREVARTLGLSASTLTRVRQGQRPDAEAFAVLLAWLELPAGALLSPDDPALAGQIRGGVEVIDPGAGQFVEAAAVGRVDYPAEAGRAVRRRRPPRLSR